MAKLARRWKTDLRARNVLGKAEMFCNTFQRSASPLIRFKALLPTGEHLIFGERRYEYNILDGKAVLHILDTAKRVSLATLLDTSSVNY